MTHTGTVTKNVDFGRRSQSVRDFRETKHHFIDSNGEKFSKKTGNSLSGYKYKGFFIGEVLDLSTVKLKTDVSAPADTPC